MTHPGTPVRWLLFISAAAAAVVLLLVMDRAYATLVFGLLLIAAGVAGLVSLARYPVTSLSVPLATPVKQVTTRRLMVIHGLTVGAIVVLIASAQAFKPDWSIYPDDHLGLALPLLAGGWLLLAGAVYLSRSTPFYPALPVPQAVTETQTRHHTLHWLMAGAGVICLWLLAESNGNVVGLVLRTTSHLQFALWAGGIVLVTVGLGGFRWRKPMAGSLPWVELGLLALIVGLALALRLWSLEITARFLADELAFTDAILHLLRSPYAALLEPVSDIGGFPHIFPYIQAHTVNLIGHNFSGLRFPSPFLGALHVAAAYLLARTLFDRKTALIAALLLATFPPHIHFSRLGLTELPGALCGTAALAFLARGVFHGRRGDYVLAGVCLGLTQYFHEGGRLLYVPLAVTWVIALTVLYRLRPHWRGLALMLAVLVIIAAPNYYTLIGMERSLATRLTTSNVALDALYWESLGGDYGRYIREQIINPLLMYVHTTDGAMFYLGEVALVIPLLGPAFLLGVGYALLRWRKPGLLLLLIWLAAITAGNSLLLVSTSTARYVIVFAGVALLMAVGVRYTAPLLLPETQANQRLYRLVLGGLVVVLALAQVDYYFNQHVAAYNHRARELWQHRDGQDVVLRSLSFPPGTHLHLISQREHPAGNYIAGLLAFMNPAENLPLALLVSDGLTADYLRGLPSELDHAFFIEPEDTATLALLRDHFYLLPPQYSPYPYIERKDQYVLYYSPYITLNDGQRLRPGTENP